MRLLWSISLVFSRIHEAATQLHAFQNRFRRLVVSSPRLFIIQHHVGDENHWPHCLRASWVHLDPLAGIDTNYDRGSEAAGLFDPCVFPFFGRRRTPAASICLGQQASLQALVMIYIEDIHGMEFGHALRFCYCQIAITISPCTISTVTHFCWQ